MTETKARRRVVWFARGGGLLRAGPYESQARAAAALITTSGAPVEGAFVWPEELEEFEEQEEE